MTVVSDAIYPSTAYLEWLHEHAEVQTTEAILTDLSEGLKAAPLY